MNQRPHLTYDRGTLLLDGCEGSSTPVDFVADERVGLPRAPGDRYREVFAALHRQFGAELRDDARAYEDVALVFRAKRTPYDHQREALQAWKQADGLGMVVLPTGSGKTFVAELAMATTRRSTLVVVPTLDLMNQWYARLLTAFRLDEVGLIGGGYYEARPVTVTTYDSFSIHAERIGNAFGLVVFDECHHLPSPSYAAASRCYIAPFRLGLTATPERDNESLDPYEGLTGPVVYRRHIKEFAGAQLADYDTRRIRVELSSEERRHYTEARQTYLGFIRNNRIPMGRPDGWSRFIQLCARSRAGRNALLAYREQRRIALTCSAKLDLLEVLLTRHADDRMIIFTNDNETVYRISEYFLVPSITHQTPTKERKEILDHLRSGRYRAVATSRVLNEGVDIPTASVAVVLSGTGSVREHVQRLGRILRRGEGKHALLYEVLAEDTMETNVSDRRREHDAYR
jgi:superfamily II DNA or RNA helicase